MSDTSNVLNLDTSGSDGPTSVNGVKADELRRIVDRIERLEEQKQGISDDIKLVKAEAKSEGFDVKTLNAIIKLRKKDSRTVQEEEELMDIYKRALGMDL